MSQNNGCTTVKSAPIENKNAEMNLSAEDILIRDEMLQLLKNLQSGIVEECDMALEKLKKHCQSDSTAINTLPRHIRFLYDKIEELKEIHSKWNDSYEAKKDLANIISSLSLIETKNLDCLKYRKMGRKDALTGWGIEYVRHLAKELVIDFENRMEEVNDTQNIFTLDEIDLVNDISVFYMNNNCEIDAVDLYLELDFDGNMENLINERNVEKICKYLIKCANFSQKDDFLELTRYCFGLFWRFNNVIESFLCACHTLDSDLIHETVLRVVDEAPARGYRMAHALIVQKQLALMLADYGIYYEFTDESKSITRSSWEDLQSIISNKFLITAHRDLTRELDILKPLTPDDIHKISSQKLSAYYSAGYVNDPARLNMASAFVSGLVNAVYQVDALLVSDPNYKWLLTQKETSLMNCIACFGLIFLWDVGEAPLFIDKFLNSSDRYVKAGAILALGISSCNVIDEFGSNWAILEEYLYDSDVLFQKNAVMAIGLALTGTDNQEAIQELIEFLISEKIDKQVRGVAAVAIGMIGCATNLINYLDQVFIDLFETLKGKLDINDMYHRMIPLGLGLLHSTRVQHRSYNVRVISKIPGDFGKWCSVMMKICSNIGTGSPLVIQKLSEYIFSQPADNQNFTNNTDKPVTNPDQKVVQKDSAQTTVEPGNKTSNENIKHPTTQIGSHDTLIHLPQSSDEVHSTIKSVIDNKNSVNDKTTSVQKIETPSKDDNIAAMDQKSSNKADEPKISLKKALRNNKEENPEMELIQGLATVGIALISLFDEINQKMAVRLYSSFLQFGPIGVRRAVPVGLGILYASNPQVSVIELLSKLSHDIDQAVSCNAIIALGIVAAGTNNSRVANLLRNLNIFFYRDPMHLFAIRLAQGLVHLSKGVMTMTPHRADNGLLSPTVVASLLTHAVISLDIKNTYISMDPSQFFWLVPSMKLRALITYDEKMNMIPVTVRIGQPVDDIGQASKAYKITGFQTQRTPILINVGERVEIASDKYEAYTNIMEGIVIVKEASGAKLESE